MVAEEDKEQETMRLREEQRDRDEIELLLGDMDRSWEQQKTMEQEQATKKRRNKLGLSCAKIRPA